MKLPASLKFSSSRYTNAVVNHPPVADAGPDQNIQATSPERCLHSTGRLQVSATPTNDPLTYVWTDESNNVVGNSAIVQVALQAGTHAFTLTVTDPGKLSSSATTHVTITAPVKPSAGR